VKLRVRGFPSSLQRALPYVIASSILALLPGDLNGQVLHQRLCDRSARRCRACHSHDHAASIMTTFQTRGRLCAGLLTTLVLDCLGRATECPTPTHAESTRRESRTREVQYALHALIPPLPVTIRGLGVIMSSPSPDTTSSLHASSNMSLARFG
jgi:hypothetical protein